jgi:hypothetical protein
VFGAFLEGWRRVRRAKAATASIVLAILLAAIPLEVGLGRWIEPRLGKSLEAEGAVALWDAYSSGRAWGLRDLIDWRGLDWTIVGAEGAYLFLWLFLSGGIIDRVARDRRVGTAHFFGTSGACLMRFLRLGCLVGLVPWALFEWASAYRIHPAVVLAAVAVVSYVSDFAKVRMVVEDRRSALGSIAAALRFMRRRPIRILGLYVLNVLVAVLILLAWRQFRGAVESPAGLAFILGQLYVALRIVAKLAFTASEVAFFQQELAHASYTATPEILWPDSPAVEAIRNLSQKTKPAP